MTIDQLSILLFDFDDTPKRTLQDAFKTLTKDDAATLLGIVFNAQQYNAASKAWLVKNCAVLKIDLPNTVIAWIKNQLITNNEWHCLLNLLQLNDAVFECELLQEAEFQPTLFNRFYFLLSNEKAMIQAWAYHGLIRLAYFHREYQAQVLAMVRLAEKDGSGSIVARIRNSLKKYPLS